MNWISFWLVIALIVSNGLWWLHVRHLSGVTSDLKDVVQDVKNASAKVSSAGDQVQGAVKKMSN